MACLYWSGLTQDLMDHCLNIWGEAIKYHTTAGEIYLLSGIVDFNALMVDPETHVTIQSTQPQVRLKSTDLGHTPDVGDSVIIRGQHYQMIEAQADSQGTILCLLHQDNDTAS